jgi:hypothetical protein
VEIYRQRAFKNGHVPFLVKELQKAGISFRGFRVVSSVRQTQIAVAQLGALVAGAAN